MRVPRPLPLGTLLFVTAALVADAWPGLSAHLALERAPVLDGQPWRLLTGHLVHELPRVALLDLTAFALLGSWLERRSRSAWAAVLAASALASSLALLGATSFDRCIGSSGLVWGLLGALLVLGPRVRPAVGRRVLTAIVGALLAVKLALELGGSWPAALGGLPADHATASAMHLAGLVAGVLVASLTPAARSTRFRVSEAPTATR